MGGRVKGQKDVRPRKQRPIGFAKTDNKGYVWIKTGTGQTYRKRSWIIMEQVLGRVIQLGEEVHHKNGIKDDDRPENLEILTKSQHSSLTATEQHKNNNFGRTTWYEGTEERLSKEQSERMKNKSEHMAKMRAGWTLERADKISKAMIGNTNGKNRHV
jgi:HNH endonuclease